MRFKPLVLGAALLGALTIGVVAAGATQTFKSGLYQNQPYSCANGSMIDPSGQSFGTFAVTETHGDQVVLGHVAVDNMRGNLWYRVTITEYGPGCMTGFGAWPGDQPIWMWVDSNRHGSVDFLFWAHTRATSAWVTIQHGNVMTVRSMALPINR